MVAKQLTFDFLSPKVSNEHLVHMCLNADCFYCEAVLDFHDLVWKDHWCTELEDLTPIPHCPSCGDVAWRELK